MQPCAADLRLHFEPTAFEKGLALRFRGEHNFVHADPLLVERVLRNQVPTGDPRLAQKARLVVEVAEGPAEQAQEAAARSDPLHDSHI